MCHRYRNIFSIFAECLSSVPSSCALVLLVGWQEDCKKYCLNISKRLPGLTPEYVPVKRKLCMYGVFFG